jgi:hypothetical protein
MYADNVLQAVTRDLATSGNTSMQWTMAVTIAGSIYFKSVTLPDTASVLRVYSNAAIRLALSEQPVAISTATFVVGSVLNASEWGVFALANGLSRTLQMTSAGTATITMDLY